MKIARAYVNFTNACAFFKFCIPGLLSPRNGSIAHGGNCQSYFTIDVAIGQRGVELTLSRPLTQTGSPQIPPDEEPLLRADR